MATIETLLVKIEADTARLRRELERGDAAVAASARKIESSIDRANNALASITGAAGVASKALGALGVGLSVGALVTLGRRALDAAGGIGELAEQLGLSARSLQAYQFAAAQAGVSAEQLQTAFLQLNRRIGDAASGNDQAIGAFERMGVGVLDASGKVRSAESVVGSIADAIKAIPDPAERAAAAAGLFGESGARLLPILSQGSDGLKRWAAEAENAGALLNDKLIGQADEAADKIAAMELAAGKAAETFMAQLAPAITFVFDNLRKNLGGATELEKIVDLQARIGDLEGVRDKTSIFGVMRQNELKAAREELDILLELRREMTRGLALSSGGPVAVTSNPEGDAARKKRLADEAKAQEELNRRRGEAADFLQNLVKAENARLESADGFLKSLEHEKAALQLRLSGQEELIPQLEAEAKLRDILGRDLMPEQVERLKELTDEQMRLNKALKEQEEAERKAKRAAEEAVREIQRRTAHSSDRILDLVAA